MFKQRFFAFLFCANAALSKVPYWDGTMDPIQGDPLQDRGCYNKTIEQKRGNNSSVSYEMCLRISKDVISEGIRKTGCWEDCLPLLNILHKSDVTVSSAKHVHSNSNKPALVLDVGGNIGSCALMMAAMGVNVVSFEPLPSNLYYFSRSVKMNVEKGALKKDQIRIYPYGAGNKQENLTIYTEKGNAGNTVLKTALADTDKHLRAVERVANLVVQTVRIDDAIWPANDRKSGVQAPEIVLMKIDVQGFEIHALQGAHELLAAGAIKVIQVELSSRLLQGQGGSSLDLCRLLLHYGYSIYGDEHRQVPLTLDHCLRNDRTHFAVDIYAFRKP